MSVKEYVFKNAKRNVLQEMSAKIAKRNVRHKVYPQKKNTKRNVRHKICPEKKHKKTFSRRDMSAKKGYARQECYAFGLVGWSVCLSICSIQFNSVNFCK